MRSDPALPVLVLGLTLLGTACGSLPGLGEPRRELSPSASERGTRLLDELHLGRLDRSPALRARLQPDAGPPYWPLDEVSARRERRNLLEQEASRIEGADRRGLDPAQKLGLRAALRLVRRDLERLRWSDHEPILSSTQGLHVAGPQLFLDLPDPRSSEQMGDQLDRLRALGPALRQLAGNVRGRQALGTLPPRRVIERARVAIAALLRGAPFDQDVAATPDPMAPSDGVLLQELRRRIGTVPLVDDADRRAWMREATSLLQESVGPAYHELDLTLEELAPKAPIDVGAWARPRGRAWYSSRVSRSSELDLSPDDLHAYGLREVARLRDELRLLQDQLGSSGNLERFLNVLREDDRLSLPSDGAGRAALLEEVSRWTATSLERQNEMLDPPLELELDIRLCPPPLLPVQTPVRWAPASPGSGFDGSLLVETAGWDQVPRWIAPAWTSAAGIPGTALRQRHLAANRKLQDLLRFASAPALEDGWALFAARQADEQDIYETPQAKLGRMVLELWHASLLVADTGLHAQRWSRVEAVDYLFDGTSFPRSVCVDTVERLIEEPGRACAALPGLRALIELEAEAQEALGDRFSPATFHDAVLSAGPLPLDLLREAVEFWIDERS